MKSKTLPKVSFIILSFNGQRLLEMCLKSIRKQDYPQNKIEIIVVDNGSADKSVLVAKKYKSRVFIRTKTNLYENWAFALHKCTGKYTYMVDQDIELRSKNFLKLMITPLIQDKSIMASFTRAYPNDRMSNINKYLSYHPFMCDPLYEYLTPSLDQSVVKKDDTFTLCKFNLVNIPAESRMLYRLCDLKKTASWKMDSVFDHDLLVKSVKAGFKHFAYVPQAGFYHYHAKDLGSMLKKRARNLWIHYFPYQDTLEYKWMETSDKSKIKRMILWVMYANLFFPAAIRGAIRAIRNRDSVLLLEPVVVIATTDTVLYNFLISAVGRNIIKRSLWTLIKSK